MVESIANRVREAWTRAQVSWQGEAASAFYGQYIRPMEDSGARFDAACRTLADRTQLLSRELDNIERELSE